MSSIKRKLAIVQWGSFRSFPVGGISTFVESIIPHLGQTFELKLIGMSMGEPLGAWTKINVAGSSYDFLPVIRPGQSKIMPDRLRLAHAISKYLGAIRLSGAEAFYVHMTEGAIPLVAFGDRPVIVHVHGLYNLFRFSRHWLGASFARIYDAFYPELFSRCAKVLGAGTEAEFEKFQRAMHVRSGSAIPTCVREGIFHPRDREAIRRELGIGAKEFVLLYVGRMTETKNPLLLLQAARLLRKEIPDFKLVFVGDGPLRSRVAAEAAPDPNVTITGVLPPEQTARWMNAADALAVVSKTEAFTSIVALEALSCGLPVVATPVSALPEVIHAGTNGIVSDGFTPEAYAAAVRNLLHHRPSTENCRRSVQNYTSAAVADRVTREILPVLESDSLAAD